MHPALFAPTPVTAQLTLDTVHGGVNYSDRPGAGASNSYDGDLSR
jgi:hypothetical protein